MNLRTNPPKCLQQSPQAGDDDDDGRTKFLIVTNRVDALHEEGKQLAEALQDLSCTEGSEDRCSDVKHISTNGGHWIGMLTDVGSSKKVGEYFHEIVFGNK